MCAPTTYGAPRARPKRTRPGCVGRLVAAASAVVLILRLGRAMRILLVTQMWPTPVDPDLGSFLVPVVRELRAGGHEVEVCAVARRGGPPTKYARLLGAAVAAARRTRPDVLFAHFLFPAGAAGLAAARVARAPLVVMAHGQDV